MISRSEKVAYSLGDVASNLVFQVVLLYLAFFYTDQMGLEPADVGMLFLVVRVIDAVTDPLLGYVADRTRSRWGAYRPYIWGGAIPLGICFALVFIVPDYDYAGRLVYAYITYSLMMMAYTAVNIPYSALAAVISPDPRDQVSIQSYRFIGAMLGGIIVTAVMGPLVDYFAFIDFAGGYFIPVTLMAIVGVVLFWLCFRGTRERVVVRIEPGHTLTEDIQALWRNHHWRLIALMALLLLTGNVIKTTLVIYYLRYFLAMGDHVSVVLAAGMLMNLLGCFAVNLLPKHYDKAKVLGTIMTATAVVSSLAILAPSTNAYAGIGGYLLWCFVFQSHAPIFWAMITETARYGEAKTGIRQAGVVVSTVIFMIKVGVAIGGALAVWVLMLADYEAGSVLTDESKATVALGFSVFPAVFFIIVAALAIWYKKLAQPDYSEDLQGD